jgi:hypothetical protein
VWRWISRAWAIIAASAQVRNWIYQSSAWKLLAVFSRDTVAITTLAATTAAPKEVRAEVPVGANGQEVAKLLL